MSIKSLVWNLDSKQIRYVNLSNNQISDIMINPSANSKKIASTIFEMRDNNNMGVLSVTLKNLLDEDKYTLQVYNNPF